MAYNGHKNRNFWNVSLWLNNTEDLYRAAKEIAQVSETRADAAEVMTSLMKGYFGGLKTPDGCLISKSAVRAAMVGL